MTKKQNKEGDKYGDIVLYDGSGDIKTKLLLVDRERVKQADWNYKNPGTPEQIEDLAKSIEKDRSAGILAVREVDGMYESMDGNHRLEALDLLGWKRIIIESFGDVKKGTGVTIARRRNHQYFEDDFMKLANLMKEDVLEEYTIEELAEFMPESELELNKLMKITEFSWDMYNTEDQDAEGEDDEGGDKTESTRDVRSNAGKDYIELHLKLPKSDYDKWETLREIESESTDLETFNDMVSIQLENYEGE